MKQDRVEFRTTHHERQRIEKAAAFLGMNVSSYLRMIALEKSDEVLKSNSSLTLSINDWNMFMDLIENPPKPNKNLKSAIAKYKRSQKE
jgi:uncharacterized protein (DUF1778 family)